jgi:uncharacterized glyoxalase superfamily protein PhnB
MNNRSVPASTILPHLVYHDVAAAIAWLSSTFGFVEHYRYGDPASPQGAQLHLGDAWIMLSSARPGSSSPTHLGARTQSLTLFVPDVAAHYAHAKSKAAKIVEEPHETIYGEFQYAAEDAEGHLWLFSQHARDLAPEEWGATVATK